MIRKELLDMANSFAVKLDDSLPVTHDPEVNISQEIFKNQVLSYLIEWLKLQIKELIESGISSPELHKAFKEFFMTLEKELCSTSTEWKPARLVVRSIAYEYGRAGLRSWSTEDGENELKKLFILFRSGKELSYTSLSKLLKFLVSSRINPSMIKDDENIWIIFMPDYFKLDPIRYALLLHETSHIWVDEVYGRVLSSTSDKELIFDYLATRACGIPYAKALMEYLELHEYIPGVAGYPNSENRYSIIINAIETSIKRIKKMGNSELLNAYRRVNREMKSKYKKITGNRWENSDSINHISDIVENEIINDSDSQKASQKVEDFLMKPTPWHVAGKTFIDRGPQPEKVPTLLLQYDESFIDEQKKQILSNYSFGRIVEHLEKKIPIAAHPVAIMNAYCVLEDKFSRGWINEQLPVFSESLEKWWITYEYLDKQGTLVRRIKTLEHQSRLNDKFK